MVVKRDISTLVYMGVSKIADALQMNLEYKDGVVSAQDPARNIVYAPLPLLGIPLAMRVVKLFCDVTMGLLVHVAGDLYLVVAYNPESMSVGAFLIDGSTTPIGPLVEPNMGLKEVVAALRPYVVASFLHQNGKWVPLTLPT